MGMVDLRILEHLAPFAGSLERLGTLEEARGNGFLPILGLWEDVTLATHEILTKVTIPQGVQAHLGLFRTLVSSPA